MTPDDARPMFTTQLASYGQFIPSARDNQMHQKTSGTNVNNGTYSNGDVADAAHFQNIAEIRYRTNTINKEALHLQLRKYATFYRRGALIACACEIAAIIPKTQTDTVVLHSVASFACDSDIHAVPIPDHSLYRLYTPPQDLATSISPIAVTCVAPVTALFTRVVRFDKQQCAATFGAEGAHVSKRNVDVSAPDGDKKENENA
ncbi:hypothetical protein EVAR_81396_1 [Eumeta japonica]|uniref:Uncharacterized protein n=1 Tax=Eumeta variegata TaxID=151549 RepID=A0A4C1WI20_EUMVA|nr:hypothetical protein EVAR_81396_1 [Eumeta japonica]